MAGHLQRVVWAAMSMIAAAGDGATPSQVFYHGQIVTMDDQSRIATAMAVAGDRIVAVGTDAEILALADANTPRIDLAGKMVLPGLIDSHVHAAGAAVYEFDHEIPPMESVEEVLDYVATRAAQVPEGEWITIQQVFVTRLTEPRFPNRTELDRIAPKHPVCFRTGPDASLNSLALERNQITRDFQVPGDLPAKIERDATGEPTGIIRNYGRLLKIGSYGQRPNAAQRQSALAKLLADYNSVGITGVAERNAGADTVALYQGLKDAEQLSCRVFLYWGVDPNAPWPEVQAKIQEAIDHPAHAYDPWIWLRGVKVFLDGGMLTGSAYMRQPWGVSQVYSIDDPAYRGLIYIQPERLYQLSKFCLENQLQPTAHAVGDGAVDALIAAYRQVNESFPVAEGRPCITHANFMSAEAVAAMRELGIVADLQPVWLWLDGATLLRQFGQQRLRYFQPYRSLFDQGVIVGGGSDHMQKIGSLRSVNPYDPWLGIWVALQRMPRRAEQPLHDEQRITREEALRLYTINNAYILLDEANRGSLEAGKLADFIVIDRDYLNCPVEEIRDIRVERTYVGGRCVYTKE